MIDLDAILNPPPPHPCVTDGCPHLVAYDDEPACFGCSPDSGSSVAGYSWIRLHPT